MADQDRRHLGKGGLRGVFARFSRERRGVVAIEFAILAPVYFLMIFGILELALISFSASALKSGISTAARQVRVGKAQCFDDSDAIDTICGSTTLAKCKSRLSVNRVTYPLGWGSASSKADFKSVSPGDIVMLSATYEWSVITPMLSTLLGDADGKLALTRSMLFKTEEFVTVSSCSGS